MRYLLAGLMMIMLACGIALADEPADEGADAAAAAKTEVTGIPLYMGPMYRSLDSEQADITLDPEFHSFHHRPVEEVGYSPLTLADFRYPVPRRTSKEFRFERLYYPDHSLVVWHDGCHDFTVNAFFFTRDMIRDHIQRLIDEYYICDQDVVQQVIDYYAEVTPQCGEAISWVWFEVDDNGHPYADRRENRFFTSYLSNFKDKFYLQFGLPGAQEIVDKNVREFLYQYRDRGKHVCGPEFKERPCPVCDKCAATVDCDKCECMPECGDTCGQCMKCPDHKCECPERCTRAGDDALYCTDYEYSGFDIDINSHYLYYPRKVVIEDITYDPVAQAYRWKFAWRFNDCEVEWLRAMCEYGVKAEFALVLSDPHWYAETTISKPLKRDILAAMDPDTWGNVWPAQELPYDMSCCCCPLPDCPGNCQPQPCVGWDYVEPTPEPEPVVTPPPPPPPPPADDFSYFPEPEEEEEPVVVPGKG